MFHVDAYVQEEEFALGFKDESKATWRQMER